MHAHSKQMERLYQYHAKEIIVHVYTIMYVQIQQFKLPSTIQFPKNDIAFANLVVS